MVVMWQIELAKMLLESGQTHLFEHWPEPGVEDEEKKAFFDQVLFYFLFFLLWIYNYMEILFFHVDFFFHDCGVDLYVKICELF